MKLGSYIHVAQCSHGCLFTSDKTASPLFPFFLFLLFLSVQLKQEFRPRLAHPNHPHNTTPTRYHTQTSEETARLFKGTSTSKLLIYLLYKKLLHHIFILSYLSPFLLIPLISGPLSYILSSSSQSNSRKKPYPLSTLSLIILFELLLFSSSFISCLPVRARLPPIPTKPPYYPKLHTTPHTQTNKPPIP
ncbi:hypothetical protein QBC38DRAFT_180069 [Podospora fimiseda]|uniref:Uncharacterized protein n=1 Tax=Podospora fimiseda TaxID=252190 RepID=A0AAN7BYL9_9PEZI|nr:hypothetical protein QBC38DRAFT_180069 [Podospora fimiseda]